MADKVQLEVEVGGVEQSINSVKELKNALKAAKDEQLRTAQAFGEGSKEFIEASKNVSKLKDKVEDLAGGVEQSINSVKELKNALKAAKDEQLRTAQAFGEGSKEFIAASKNVSKLKDKVEDLADSTKSLKGSGIERASAGFQQLGEGLRNLDFDKVKTGLIAMKSALAAVGIGIIVQLVSYLIENFDKLSSGSGMLAKVLRGVGDIIGAVTDKIYEFTDALGITNSTLDKMGDAIKGNADKAKEALAGQTAEYDRQIEVAKASGKSAVDLEIAKQQAIIETNRQIAAQILAYQKAGGELDKQKKADFLAAIDGIKSAAAAEKVIVLNADKEKLDNAKKLFDEKEKLRVNAGARFKADISEQNDEEYDAQVAQLAKIDALNVAANDKKLEDERLTLAASQAGLAKIRTENTALDKKDAEQKEADEKAARDGKIALAKASNDSLIALTDLFFEYKRSTLQKGSAEEIKAAEKQFKVNRALQIANAVIMGIQGVIAAYSSGSAIPLIGAVAGPAFAILAGVAAATNIAKIAAAKFNPGASSAPSISGGGGGGVPSIPPAPTINTPKANTNQNTTFDSTGKNTSATPTPQVHIISTVSVEEINKKQNQVNVLEKQATF